MSLLAGERVGPYQILALIGTGGMGQVYRARDTRLDRDVAIKFSKEQFSERFEREARAVASLNHPNICHLYDVGPDYLVMELIEGKTPAGPLPPDEVYRLAQQIAAALDAAHEKGIVHRDLKPDNIKVTADGVVKVLDFGLAKLGAALPSGEDSPTITLGATEAGMVLGTAAYMSPEQARGKPVDRRADIWAFGVVLYELLTGERLYLGETVSDTLAAVLREEPEWDRVPVRFRPLLRRCLQKDPKNRLRDIGDAMSLIPDPAIEMAAGKTRSASRAPWAVAALFAAAAATLAAIHFRERTPAPPPVVRYRIPVPTNGASSVGSFTISPDGRHLAFSAVDKNTVPRVWIQDIDAVEARPLTATSTGPNVPPFFWSPDSRFVVYSENSNKLKMADIQSGAVREICDKPGPPVGGSWNRDGVIIFGSTIAGLWKVPASGGTPAPLTKTDAARGERSHQLPSFLPDGRHFLYYKNSSNPDDAGIYAGSLDDPPERQSRKRILATGFGAYFVPSGKNDSGWLLFQRESSLLAQPFDPGRLELSGEPNLIADQVGSAFQTGMFSANKDALIYRTSTSARGLQLSWLDIHGKRIGTAGEPGPIVLPRISPDGARIAYQMNTPQSGSDIWLLDIRRNVSTRFTFGPGPAASPVWSPDGSEIVFSFRKGATWDLYRKPSNGGHEAELLLETGEHKRPWSWSRDGRYLIYGSSNYESFVNEDLWVLPLDRSRTPYKFVITRYFESEAAISPDGRWVAYGSNEGGPYQIYVRPFPESAESAAAGGKWLVSKEDGRYPVWNPDGSELLYLSERSSLRAASAPAVVLAVSVDRKGTFQTGAPHELFQAPLFGLMSPAHDFQRFLARVPVDDRTLEAFTVVLNWPSALSARPSPEENR